MESKSIYKEKPWLKHYPPGVPAEVEIPEKSLCEAFDEATQKWKDRTAIIFYGNKISYGQIREKVDRFATALSHLGIKKGDTVALLLLNCPQYIIAFYGALKTGATITPVSPVYVSPEIRYQLEDSEAKTIICQDFLYGNVEETGFKFENVILTSIGEFLPASARFLGKSILRGIYQKMALPPAITFKQEGFYQFQELLKKFPPNPPTIEVNPKEDIVALPYTGGTTGPPKGVMITHYNHIAVHTMYRAFYPFLEDGKEVGIAYMPFYHIAGQWTTVVSGIISGQTTVIITTPDLDEIINAIMRYEVTTFGGAPTLYEFLKDYEKTRWVDWKKLKFVGCGADALLESTFRDWKSRTGVDLNDMYGMTETTGFSHSTPLGKSKAGAVGIPLPSTLAAVADPDKDEFLPLGEIGEFVIMGPQLCKGYWNNPEATRECEAIIDGEKWWRTGDLGFMDEEGYFHIYDRKRDLIKYKGLRVFAREVEDVLKTHPKIKEVGVVGVKDIKVGDNIKAFVVLEADARGELSEANILEYCKGRLAHYKIPKIIEFVGEIPKTDVGKISRRELRETEEA